jgi:hypothetical protein
MGLQIAIFVVIGLLVLEVGLFWAAVALADGPPIGVGKTVVGALLVALVCGGVSGLLAWLLGLHQLQADEAMTSRILPGAGLAAVVFVILGTVLCTPLLPVSPGKGLIISVVQLLLRALLYALVAALIMVILAVFQLSRRAEAPRNSSSALATLPSHSFRGMA